MPLNTKIGEHVKSNNSGNNKYLTEEQAKHIHIKVKSGNMINVNVTMLKRCIGFIYCILMTDFSLVVFYIFISTSSLYVQQFGQITGAALCDVYKWNAKSTNK